MRRPAVVAVVVAVAAVLVGTSTPPASAAPHRGESITVVFVGTPGVSGTVVARGSVFDIGTLTPSDSDTDALVFPDGTLLIHQSGTTVVHPPTPPACIVWFTTTGTYHVVGGTGRIAGATGAGNNRLRPRAGQPIRDRLRRHRAVRLRQDRHPRKPDHPVSRPSRRRMGDTPRYAGSLGRAVASGATVARATQLPDAAVTTAGGEVGLGRRPPGIPAR